MSFQGKLIARALEQWTLFGRDEDRDDKFIDAGGNTTKNETSNGVPNRRKETVDPFSSHVANYWLGIPSKQYDDLVKKFAKAKGRLDGTVDLAWSAAFISYCMQMAGAGSNFPYSSGHATWMVQSIKNRSNGKLKAALVGFRLGEIPLKPGDLIARPRQDGITYDNAVEKGWFISHSDIVVEVDKEKNVAYVVGGNVGQSVSKAKVTIDSDGKLNDTDGWMVHIQNNIAIKDTVVASLPTHEARVG
ncbi:DUF2272 domain-containing protein [Bradyrhizobium sp. 170]|uniref:DUF2272 domain-containing protein n=1 Tax=Bradyrhizobium sp. 170 TaxID=2782641 RepID=UPI001FFFEE7A|nr:DUF2272 domain-containing protein [Bradyrhizobium sp. 170]UPK00894.1 DUF2272 domain-containing protein [Bradyrhizobium sp. 170]